MTKQPTFYRTEQAAIENMPELTASRSRPVMAKAGDHKFVVCCKTTAKKYQWEVLGKLYFRNPRGVAQQAVKQMAEAAKGTFFDKLNAEAAKRNTRKSALAAIDKK